MPTGVVQMSNLQISSLRYILIHQFQAPLMYLNECNLNFDLVKPLVAYARRASPTLSRYLKVTVFRQIHQRSPNKGRS